MNLTERIRERFEAAQTRLAERKRSIDRDAVAILAEAHSYAMRADKYRARKEENTRPADLLTDSDRNAIDNLVLFTHKKSGAIAKSLGLTKEYVDDYLRSMARA
jgi:protein-tyrosine-phosphatase